MNKIISINRKLRRIALEEETARIVEEVQGVHESQMVDLMVRVTQTLGEERGEEVLRRAGLLA